MGCTRAIAAELVLQSWRELFDSAVAAGWDYGEALDEEEEDDAYDGEFQLQITTDSDDEDVMAMQNEGSEEEDAEE
jgi:hypothetical protein